MTHPQVVVNIHNAADPETLKDIEARLSNLLDSVAIIRSLLRTVLTNQENLMSKISDFALAQKTFNEKIGADIDGINTAIDGIKDDVQSLNDKITELQNSAGGVTPEDQALIDGLVAAGQALQDKMDTLAAKAQALDAQTPPVVPPV